MYYKTLQKMEISLTLNPSEIREFIFFISNQFSHKLIWWKAVIMAASLAQKIVFIKIQSYI